MNQIPSPQEQAQQAPRRVSIFSTLASAVGSALGRGADKERADAYLNDSTSIADLESRMRQIDRDDRSPRGGF